jgi:hypothetical protein
MTVPKRFVVTLPTSSEQVNRLLRQIQAIGATISSMQLLLGTAIVEVKDDQGIRALKEIEGIDIREERQFRKAMP